MNNLAQYLTTLWNLDSSARAVEFGDKSYTWAQMRDIAGRVDALLTAQGLGKGTPVGALLRNRPPMVAAILGLLATERCIVSINPYYKPEALASEVAALNVSALMADQSDWTPEITRAAGAQGTVGISLSDSGAALVPGADKKGAGPHRELPEGIALEILTSGTTGKPKRLRAKFSALADAVLPAPDKAGNRPAPALRGGAAIVAAPVVHLSGIFGMLHSFCEGRTVVLLEKFNVLEWANAVERHKIKFASVPPTAMRMVLDANVPKSKLASLVAVRSGTAPLPPETQQRFQDTYGVPVLLQYSATEWLGGIAGWTIEEFRKYMPAKLGSTGRAHPGVKLRVVDPASFKELPANEVGLLEVLPSRRFGPDAEWNRTTDLARIDEDGFLYILGRSDDVIIRGGFKVSLPAVAEVVNQHPAVKDAAVLPIADARLGEVPVCAVELHEGAKVPPLAELEQFCRERLLPYQVPVQFKIVDALPRTVSLKVDRPATRALFTAA